MSGILSRCRAAVVTPGAGSHDGSMIEVGRYPGIARMAVLASIAAGNMRRVLAGGNRAVMAARTSPDHIEVINPNDQPPKC